MLLGRAVKVFVALPAARPGAPPVLAEQRLDARVAQLGEPLLEWGGAGRLTKAPKVRHPLAKESSEPLLDIYVELQTGG